MAAAASPLAHAPSQAMGVMPQKNPLFDLAVAASSVAAGEPCMSSAGFAMPGGHASQLAQMQWQLLYQASIAQQVQQAQVSGIPVAAGFPGMPVLPQASAGRFMVPSSPRGLGPHGQHAAALVAQQQQQQGLAFQMLQMQAEQQRMAMMADRSGAPLHRTPKRKPRRVSRPRKSVVGRVCACCGADQTPMWREVKSGRSLCNACGIRWRKHKRACLQCHVCRLWIPIVDAHLYATVHSSQG